jgi:phytanoyl-CoA hydroxylase
MTWRRGTCPKPGTYPWKYPKGTLVVLHGKLPHKSSANRSERTREAFTLHIVEGEAAYPSDNWLQRAADFPAKGF